MSDNLAYNIHTDGNESRGPEGMYLVWLSPVRGECEVENRDTLEDALHCYAVNEDNEHHWPECIEGPAGIVPQRDVEDWTAAYWRRSQMAASERVNGLIGQVRFCVELSSPLGHGVAEFDTTNDLGEAVAIVGELNRPGRVRVVEKTFTTQGRWERTRVIIDWRHNDTEAAA